MRDVLIHVTKLTTRRLPQLFGHQT